MKDDITEYYTNGDLKHRISYYPNGNIHSEYFYDHTEGWHRDNNLPAVQEWYSNGKLANKGYCIHDNLHNDYNPAIVLLDRVRKIISKSYYNEGLFLSKIDWMNWIKEI